MSDFKKLPPLGFAHFLLPLLMVAIIAIVGGYVLMNGGSAATATGAVYLESDVTGKCLDDHHDSATNGIRDDSYECNQSEAQQWTLNTNGTIENPNGKCIDNDYGKNLNNNPITVYTCSATNTAEQWTNAGNILKNPATGKCIDDPYASATNGTELILYTCNTEKQQTWNAVKTTTTTSPGSTTTGSGTSGGGNGGGSTTTGGAFTDCLNGNASTTLDGGKYKLSGNEWNSSGTFTFCTNGSVAFKITNTNIQASNYLPAIGDPYGPGGYPNLYYGCDGGGGNCTTDSGLPLKLSSMTGGGVVTSDYNTTTVNSGAWDDAYDIWFNPVGGGGLGDLEMMVWLNHAGASPAGSVVRSNVSIGGNTYNVWYGNGGGTVSYVMTNSVESVTNLDIGLLAADSIKYDYGKDGGMNANWSLENVQAGFEDFNGNIDGTTANSFSVTVK
jgi:hypothetical protein